MMMTKWVAAWDKMEIRVHAIHQQDQEKNKNLNFLFFVWKGDKWEHTTPP